MKAKLLRKVRKEYSIVNHPNGLQKDRDQMGLSINTHVQTMTLKMKHYIFNYVIGFCVIIPIQDNREYRLTDIKNFNCEKEGFRYLHSLMLNAILYKYKKYGTRRIAKRNITQKLYYNESTSN